MPRCMIYPASRFQALQHMFHKSGYNYSKNVHSYVDAGLIAGKSILSAHSKFFIHSMRHSLPH